MKNKIKCIFSLWAVALLLWGCYEDKGDYDYQEINEVDIDLPAMISVRLSKKDSVEVTVAPEFFQTLAKDESHFAYLWEEEVKKGPVQSVWEKRGEEKVCRLWFQPEDVDARKLRLTVTDEGPDGTRWYKETTVRPVVPYSRCWFVLHEADGLPVLGAVDGEGKTAVVLQNVYREDTGQELPLAGKVQELFTSRRYGDVLSGMANPEKPVIFIQTDADILLMDAVSFKPVWKYEEMMHIKKVRKDLDFAPEWVASYTAQGLGELLSDGGKLYMANDDGFSVYYPLSWDPEDAGAEESVPAIEAVCPMHYQGFILYDAVKHRFLRCKPYDEFTETWYTNKGFRMGMNDYFDPNKSIKKLVEVRENAGVKSAFDPGNIGEGKIMLGMNTVWEQSVVLATVYDKTDGKLHVYEFNGDGFADEQSAVCAGEYKLELPDAGIAPGDLSFATSVACGKVLFVGAGNKVYKYDLNRSVPRKSLVYEYPDPAVRIVGLKFRDGLEDVWSLEDPDDNASWKTLGLPYYLGVALDYGGGQGGMVELELNDAGEKKEGSEILEFKGFGKITSIGYSLKL